MVATSYRLGLDKYLLSLNCFSSSSSCCDVNAVRGLRFLPNSECWNSENKEVVVNSLPRCFLHGLHAVILKILVLYFFIAKSYKKLSQTSFDVYIFFAASLAVYRMICHYFQHVCKNGNSLESYHYTFCKYSPHTLLLNSGEHRSFLTRIKPRLSRLEQKQQFMSGFSAR